MAIFERSETYAHWTTVKDRDNVYSTPSSISISISNPCGTELLAYTAMSLLTTGQYYYNYPIPATAPFGEWSVKVRSISAGGNTSIKTSYFYILPWDIITQIEYETGIKSGKSISDDALASIACKAYEEVLNDVFYYWHDEKLGCTGGVAGTCACCSTGNIDGSNKAFNTGHRPIADHDGDGSVEGTDATLCGVDISGYWIDSNCDCQTSYITVNSAECGDITVTQTSGAAIPSNAKGAYVTYWTETSHFNKDLLRQATVFLSSYHVANRFGNLDRSTQADLQQVQNQVYRTPPAKRFLDSYRGLLSLIAVPKCGGSK